MILRALFALWTSGASQMANHLWQSTLFVVLAGTLAFALRKNQARVRYWVWLTASVKFLIPFSLLMALGSHLAKPRASTPVQASVYAAVEDFSQPFVGQDLSPIYQTAPSPASVSPFHLLPVAAVAVWLVGIGVVLFRSVIGWVRISRMVRRAAPLGEGREVDALRRLEASLGLREPTRLVLSRDWMEPGIFGIFRPVLIWPAGISQHLDDTHIEAILAHEIYHARRRDNLTAVLHMMVEAIFWFHPLVWWMRARLEEERERACDEEVSLLCNQPHVYAESILKVCKFCSESPLACVSGITGADLKKRIMQIMTERVVRKLDFGRKLLLLAVGLAMVAVPILLGQAKAAQRLAYAMLKSAPAPLRTAAHAMIAEEETPSAGPIAEQPADAGAAPGGEAGADTASLPRFEVASIHPSDPKGGLTGIFNYPGGRLDCSQCTPRYLMMEAFNLQSWQIDGGPDWTDPLKGDRYDIQAKAPQDSPVSRLDPPLTKTALNPEQREMLEALLIDRFQLKFHRETRQGPVYLLERGSKPLLLKPPKDANEYSWAGGVEGGAVTSGAGLAGTNIAMPQLAARLSGWLHRPVIDQTGLKGAYDFRYETGGNDPDANVADAIQSSLQAVGLKLVAAKGPVETVVVDSAKRPSVDGAEAAPMAMAAAPPATPAAGSSNEPTAAPQFEVATIKPGTLPSDPRRGESWSTGGPGAAPGSEFRIVNAPLKQLVEMGLSVRDNALEAPSWLDTSRFDLDAKLPDYKPGDRNAVPEMMKALLIERFGLKWHEEIRSVSGYELVADKKVLLQPATELERLWGVHGSGSGPTTVNGTNMSISDFAAALGAVLGKPVVDATHLSGGFDIKLQWRPSDDAEVARERQNAKQYGVDVDSLPDSAFTAVQEQLGLRLQSAKVPMRVVVVDQINRQPTGN